MIFLFVLFYEQKWNYLALVKLWCTLEKQTKPLSLIFKESFSEAEELIGNFFALPTFFLFSQNARS